MNTKLGQLQELLTLMLRLVTLEPITENLDITIVAGYKSHTLVHISTSPLDVTTTLLNDVLNTHYEKSLHDVSGPMQ